MRAAARDANDGLVADLFQFRNIGIPLANNWTTQLQWRDFGTDYLSRTAMGKANIFVNSPNETTYFYQDLDAARRAPERREPLRRATFPPAACRPCADSGR